MNRLLFFQFVALFTLHFSYTQNTSWEFINHSDRCDLLYDIITDSNGNYNALVESYDFLNLYDSAEYAQIKIMKINLYGKKIDEKIILSSNYNYHPRSIFKMKDNYFITCIHYKKPVFY